MTKEQLLLGLAEYIAGEGWNPEAFFREKNIPIKKIDDYIVDADDQGYAQNEIFEVHLPEETFTFIYEWYGGSWSDTPSILLANPVQVTRYEPVGDNFRDKYFEGLYE